MAYALVIIGSVMVASTFDKRFTRNWWIGLIGLEMALSGAILMN